MGLGFAAERIGADDAGRERAVGPTLEHGRGDLLGGAGPLAQLAVDQVLALVQRLGQPPGFGNRRRVGRKELGETLDAYRHIRIGKCGSV